jgi:tetratricopeptide (TPR) repeat protein
VSEPVLFSEATDLIRAGQYAVAVDRLMAGLAELPVEEHRKAYRLAGLAYYFGERWADALGMFQVAAEGSEIPEDWFNLAMAQVKIGYAVGAKETWKRVFDLSYAHQDAPETSTFFQKKLIFAQALHRAGACDELGLDLLERQLLGFFLHNHVTDDHFWLSRGVPSFTEVMTATREYYQAMGKPAEEWSALCDKLAAAVDTEGKAMCAEWKAMGLDGGTAPSA